MDAARPRSLPHGIPPLHLIVLEDIILIVIQDIVLIVLVRILHWGIQCEDVWIGILNAILPPPRQGDASRVFLPYPRINFLLVY